jgi:hypothetical protein
MWNYMNFGQAGQIAVAISETPLGPFVVVNPALNITRGSSGKSCGMLVRCLYSVFQKTDLFFCTHEPA